MIERIGKSLTTIYITHAHADHYLGLGPLLERFPNARCVALPNVIEAMKQTMELQDLQWEMLFGNATVKRGPLPAPLEGDTLYVDGSPIRIIEVNRQTSIRIRQNQNLGARSHSIQTLPRPIIFWRYPFFRRAASAIKPSLR